MAGQMQNVLQPPPGFEPLRVPLTKDGSATVGCLWKPPVDSPYLIVFLNGMMLPQVGWLPAIQNLITTLPQKRCPAILTYDRYGQGSSSPDPLDTADARHDRPAGHKHDLQDAAEYLTKLISHISGKHLKQETLQVILVANSIGCALARLYTAQHPFQVAGLILLDSIIANTDQVSMFPDPDASDFDDQTLPAGISVEALRGVRKRWGAIFHPSVPNQEGLSRLNLSQLLPRADEPKLGGMPVVVVGHDPNIFAEQAEIVRFFSAVDGILAGTLQHTRYVPCYLEGPVACPKIFTDTYVQPVWVAYNRGLATLTTKGVGPVIAPGTGHFIQKDGPVYVSSLISSLLSELENEERGLTCSNILV